MGRVHSTFRATDGGGGGDGGGGVRNRKSRKTTLGKDTRPVVFLESMVCLCPPLLLNLVMRCAVLVCLLWVNLVKVRPGVRNLRASCCRLKMHRGVGSTCPCETPVAAHKLVSALHYSEANKGS